jgi:hypothetical protein
MHARKVECESIVIQHLASELQSWDILRERQSLEVYLLLFRRLKGETLLSPNGNNCKYVQTFIFTPVLGVRDR